MTLGKILICSVMVLFSNLAVAADIDPFVGNYTGSADVDHGGESAPRNMSVEIADTKDGFDVTWSTTIQRANGEVDEKQYTIRFLQTTGSDVFPSAMKSDVFGNRVPLDPLNGDPYVWSHIAGETLTVYALNILEDGGYEMQEYRRSLADGGLSLDYRRLRNGEKLRNVKAFLKKD